MKSECDNKLWFIIRSKLIYVFWWYTNKFILWVAHECIFLIASLLFSNYLMILHGLVVCRHVVGFETSKEVIFNFAIALVNEANTHTRVAHVTEIFVSCPFVDLFSHFSVSSVSSSADSLLSSSLSHCKSLSSRSHLVRSFFLLPSLKFQSFD